MIIWKLLLSSINSQKIRKFCVWEVMIAIVFKTATVTITVLSTRLNLRINAGINADINTADHSSRGWVLHMWNTAIEPEKQEIRPVPQNKIKEMIRSCGTNVMARITKEPAVTWWIEMEDSYSPDSLLQQLHLSLKDGYAHFHTISGQGLLHSR